MELGLGCVLLPFQIHHGFGETPYLPVFVECVNLHWLCNSIMATYISVVLGNQVSLTRQRYWQGLFVEHRPWKSETSFRMWNSYQYQEQRFVSSTHIQSLLPTHRAWFSLELAFQQCNSRAHANLDFCTNVLPQSKTCARANSNVQKSVCKYEHLTL